MGPGVPENPENYRGKLPLPFLDLDDVDSSPMGGLEGGSFQP